MSGNGGERKGEFKIVEMGGNCSGENGGGGTQGRDAVENGDGKNFGIERGSISGNGPEGRVEAQEGASGVKMDNDGLVSEKARGETLEGSRSENGISTSGDGAREGEKSQPMGNLNGWDKNPQKKTFVGMMIVLMVVLLVAAGLVTFVFWWTKELATEMTDRVDSGGETVAVEEPEEKPAEPETPKVEELSLDDETVQRLYGNFESFWGINGFGFTQFYELINGTDEQRKNAMIGQILLNMQGEVCTNNSNTDMVRCYDGDKVREGLGSLFGRQDIELTGLSEYGPCGGGRYNAERDEYELGFACGGSGPAQLKRWLYKAEVEGDNIYVYDLAENWAAEFTDDEYVEFLRNVHCHTDAQWQCGSLEFDGKPGSLMNIPSDVVLVNDSDERKYDESLKRVNFLEYADELDEYKWTFTKNDDGEYVFTGLEKIK